MGLRMGLRKPPEMSPELKGRMEREAAEKKIRDEEKLLRFEERQVERAVFRKCGHELVDVTEERQRLLKERGAPPTSSKYEKCGGCGLLKVSKIVEVPGG